MLYKENANSIQTTQGSVSNKLVVFFPMTIETQNAVYIALFKYLW